MQAFQNRTPDFYCPFACGFFWNCKFKQLFHTRIYKCMACYVHSKRTCLRILSVSRYALSAVKFCVLIFYLFMEMVVFLAVFVIGGLIATKTMDVTETLPIFYLLKWCFSLFLTMLPCIGTMWAITVLFEKPLLSVGLNLLLVIPGVLVANTPLWIAYPYCYSGYLVSCSLRDFTAEASDTSFSLFPFLPCAILVFCLVFSLAITQFGKKERR